MRACRRFSEHSAFAVTVTSVLPRKAGLDAFRISDLTIDTTMDLWNDEDQNMEINETRDICPVCCSTAPIKPMAGHSYFVECETCGNYDITHDCFRFLLASSGNADGAYSIDLCPAGTAFPQLQAKLKRYLRDTKSTEGRIVSDHEIGRLPEGTSVLITFSEVAALYESSGNIEADYVAALKAWERAEDSADRRPLGAAEVWSAFPFIDHHYCQKLLNEALRKQHATQIAETGTFYLTPEGRAFLRLPLTGPAVNDDVARSAANWQPNSEPSIDIVPPKVDAAVKSDANTFARDGQRWSVSYAGKHITLEHSDGAIYIAYLFERCGTSLHVRELYAIAHPPANGAQSGLYADMAQVEYANEGLGLDHGLSSTDRIDDAALLVTCRDGREELQRDLALARLKGDSDQVNELEQRINEINAFMAAEFGLDGRARKPADPNKRAYDRVSKALARVMASLLTHHSGLAAHIKNSLHYATYAYCYSPEIPISWET